MKPSRIKHLLGAILIAVSLSTTATKAEDNTTNFIFTDGAVHGFAGDLTVGTSGTNNYGEVSNGSILTNGGNGQISLNYGTSRDNLAVISGAGSAWNPQYYMIVGFFGTGARLVITNGGAVNSPAGGIIGYYYPEVTNNTVEVTGTGSQWNVGGGLWVGGNGADNRLLISSGASVTNTGATSIGVGAGSSNNLLLVTGSGSTFVQSGSDLGLGGSGSDKLIVSDGAIFKSTNIRYSSPNSQTIVTNGGSIQTGGITVGETVGANGDLFLVTGSGSRVTSGGTSVGSSGANATLRIENGGTFTNTGSTAIGISAGSSNNLMVVTGAGSIYKNGGDFSVGGGGNNTLLITSGGFVDSPNFQFPTQNNQVTITNGGSAQTVAVVLGNGTGSSNNRFVVTGTGSVLNASYTDYALLLGFNGSSFGQFQIEEGGVVNTTAGRMYLGGYAALASSSNTVLVTGAGSQLNIGTDVLLGWGGASTSVGNQLTIADGGVLKVSGSSFLGYSGANSNTVTVTGAGSAYYNTNSASDFFVNYTGVGNQLIITNGGKVASLNGRIGTGGGSGALVKVTGNGSVWTNIGGVYIGENSQNNTLQVENGGQLYTTSLNAGFGSGNGDSIRITSGGLVQANALVANAPVGNSISNIGGIYQFTAAPSVTPNGFGRIAITDGTISYRDFTSANINDANVANIAFAGDNTFRLLNSSNTAIAAYNFDSAANTGNPANYQRLTLMGTGSRWQGTTLNIGSGGALLVSNANNAVVAAVLNSTGSISVVNSKVTYNSAVGISGSYISDPSTNTFLADVTVGVSGTMAGGAGDLFDFKKSLFIHATNNLAFNLATSAVEFSGGGVHTNALTGDDLGSGPSAFDVAFGYDRNFAYGELHIGSAADSICFECGDIPVAPSNALYVGWLDLLNSTNLVANLHVPTSINIYYSAFDTRNSYLGNQTFQLTACDGVTLGGFLIPVIAEPNVSLLLGGGLFAAWGMRRRTRRQA